MARGKYRLVLHFLLMNGALPSQPIEGVLEVSNTLIFYAEGGAFPSATDQSPKVDDGGGADVVFRVHRIHRKLDWDAGNGFTSFCDIGFNNLEREEGLGRCQPLCSRNSRTVYLILCFCYCHEANFILSFIFFILLHQQY